MGVKRPLEDVDFSEPSPRQPKQLDYNEKLTLNTEESRSTTFTVHSPGGAKSDFCKLEFDWEIGEGDTDSADKELEGSAPLSFITSSSSEEDAGNGDTSFWSYLPEYADFRIPSRPHEQCDDAYFYLLNSSHRKEVPIGPDHQAEILLSDCKKEFSGSNYLADNEREKKLMGTCIIPMPTLNDSTIDGVRVGCARTDCSCLDMGSMRCVQQHVKEAREKIRDTIGSDKFADLGFYDMGDEVAVKWTPDDEQVFHEVVFSNPVSHGKRFWKHLKAAFPSRSKKELVNYYFNVFMLRRRAAQNRSYQLDIDSDNDEGAHGELYQNGSCSLDPNTDDDDNDLQGPHRECYLVREEDEDSTVESLGDQELDSSWVDDFWAEPKVEKQDSVDSNDSKVSEEEETKKLHDESSFDS